MTEALVKQLQKEVDRLKRRNKVLIKRLKRLQCENVELEGEIDTIEALAEVAPLLPEKSKGACPKCGGALKTHDMGAAGKLILCDKPECKYREVKK